MSVRKSENPQSIVEKNEIALLEEEEEVKLDGNKKSRHKAAMSELIITKRNAHYVEQNLQSPRRQDHLIKKSVTV